MKSNDFLGEGIFDKFASSAPVQSATNAVKKGTGAVLKGIKSAGKEIGQNSKLAAKSAAQDIRQGAGAVAQGVRQWNDKRLQNIERNAALQKMTPAAYKEKQLNKLGQFGSDIASAISGQAGGGSMFTKASARDLDRADSGTIMQTPDGKFKKTFKGWTNDQGQLLDKVSSDKLDMYWRRNRPENAPKTASSEPEEKLPDIANTLVAAPNTNYNKKPRSTTKYDAEGKPITANQQEKQPPVPPVQKTTATPTTSTPPTTTPSGIIIPAGAKTAAPVQQTQQPVQKPAPTQQAAKVQTIPKIRPAANPGAPTPQEYANLQAKLKAAMDAQK
jgi:hypothetical protein